MAFGDKSLELGARGPEVTELQLRLSGFRGTLWDGVFGHGTALQVVNFQRDYLGRKRPSGVADRDTLAGLARFAKEFPIDFAALRCPCGACGGFGQGRFQGSYRAGQPKAEAFHRYEYPGIHKAILHAFRAAKLYARRDGQPELSVTCGYRCWIDNERKGRTSTNHLGKAVDADFPLRPGEDKRDDCNRCDSARGALVEHAYFQIGWLAGNRKALEPSNVAPTWLHMDVRCYEPKYLAERFFVSDAESLDGDLAALVG